MLQKYKRILSNAPQDKTFYSSQGEIRNLGELRNLLLSKGKFFYDQYVHKEENHFANWIENVFDDKELALSLKNSNSYIEAARLIDDRIKYAELWLNYNGDMEILSNFLVSDYNIYEPKHHKFETLTNKDLEFVNKPPAPLKKPEPPQPQKLDPPSFSDGEKDDHKLLKELETQLKLKGAPEPKKNFFHKINPFRK